MFEIFLSRPTITVAFNVSLVKSHRVTSCSWWLELDGCEVSREELMLHRMRSRFSDMIAMSQERRSKRSNARVRRMIAMHGRCVARQTWDPRRSSREISAWSMCNDYPDKHRKCSRPASLIANFSLTKRAQGYLFDVLKVFFLVINLCKPVHLCPCASMSSQGVDTWPLARSKANWWTGSQEQSVNAKSPLLRRSDLFDSLCTFAHMDWICLNSYILQCHWSWRWLRTVMYGYSCIRKVSSGQLGSSKGSGSYWQMRENWAAQTASMDWKVSTCFYASNSQDLLQTCIVLPRISIGKLSECLKGVDPSQLRAMPDRLKEIIWPMT